MGKSITTPPLLQTFTFPGPGSGVLSPTSSSIDGSSCIPGGTGQCQPSQLSPSCVDSDVREAETPLLGSLSWALPRGSTASSIGNLDLMLVIDWEDGR